MGMKNNGRLGLWLPEIFVALSIVLSILIGITYHRSYEALASGDLFLFTIISLVVAVYSNLKYGRSILILKRILYTVACGYAVQYSLGLAQFYSHYQFTVSSAYFVLLVQVALLTASCLTSWLTKEQPVSL